MVIVLGILAMIDSAGQMWNACVGFWTATSLEVGFPLGHIRNSSKQY